MKKSYWICSAVILFIVIVMIVTAVISDNKTKKAQVRRCAENTLKSAGCIEVDDDYVPDLESGSLPDSGEDVELSNLENATSIISQYQDSDVDGQLLFKQVGGQLLKNAKFYISSTKVNGRDATVKVHLFMNGSEGDMTLEYFYYDGEWMLSNTIEALKDISVGGRSYDEASESAYNEIVKEMENL